MKILDRIVEINIFSVDTCDFYDYCRADITMLFTYSLDLDLDPEFL